MLDSVYNPTRDGRTLYVDSVSGVDASAIANNRDRPYLTLAAAKAAAASGDTISVRPGAYTVAASLAKDGVNWHFEAGAVVNYETDSPSLGGELPGIWDDYDYDLSSSSPMVFQVTGLGTFNRSDIGEPDSFTWAVHVVDPNSAIYIEALDITSDCDFTPPRAIQQAGGSLTVKCRDVIAEEGIWWVNGEMHVSGRYCRGPIYSAVDATPTGGGHFHFDEITSDVGYAIKEQGSDSTAAFWVRANIISGSGTIVTFGNNRVYIECQKIFGYVQPGAGSAQGLFYLRADKIVSTTNGALLVVSASAKAWVQVSDFDGTDCPTGLITVTGNSDCTLDLFGGAVRSGASSTTGVTVVSGTARLHGTRIDTSNNSTANPINKTGGTLELNNCTLVAHATRDSIEATGAQTVLVRGALSINTAVDSNVTLTGGIVIRTDTGTASVAAINPTGLTTNRVTYYSGSALAVTAFTYTTDKLSTAGTSATLEQTGDTLGACRLVLLNRGGAAGARFENDGIELVDFIFKGTGSTTRTIRYENRGGVGSNTWLGNTEFQIGGTTAGRGTLIVANPSEGTATMGDSSSQTPRHAWLNASTTTFGQTVFDISTPWATATHASRKGRAVLNVWDTAARECIRLEASGSAPMLGFFGVTAVVRPTALTSANGSALNTGDATSDTVIGNIRTRVGEIETKLQALGLLT